MDRNRLEQDALAALNKGSLEGALASYQQILRLDPRDRRIRQKCGELCMRLGRPAEAEKHLREVADGFLREGQARPALAVLRQILAIVGDDAQLHMDMGEASHSAGSPTDARTHWDTAMRLWIGAARPADALRAAKRLAEQGNEPALKLKVAELLEASGDAEGAAAAYADIASEYRRRGRADEVGRVAEMALRLRPDDPELLRGAAGARLEAGDARGALVHLQLAFQKAPTDPATLDLLARAFEAVGQPDKARRVLGELARIRGEARDPAREVEALRRAVALGSDPTLEARLRDAEARLARAERRLTDLAFAAPRDEDELRAVVRAGVFARYGFHDRAMATLEAALGANVASLALRASLAEAHAAAGRLEAAIASTHALYPDAGADAAAVADRIVVLGGTPPAAVPSPVAPAVPSPDPVPTPAVPVVAAPAPVAPVAESAEARGDRLAEEGDLPGAIVAYRAALAEDPLNDEVLRKIAALRGRGGALAPAPAAAPAVTAPPSLGTFAEIDPDELDELDGSALDELSEIDDGLLDAPSAAGLEEARELLAVGMYADALTAAEGTAGLEADVLRAECRRGLGDNARALDGLKDAVAEAADTDPAYPAALFELATLLTLTQKHRVAVRTLEELRDLAPAFRAPEVEARLRGLQRLLK